MYCLWSVIITFASNFLKTEIRNGKDNITGLQHKGV